MPSDFDSLPNPDHLLPSCQMVGNTAETICSVPAREKEAILLFMFLWFPYGHSQKSFEMSESPSFWLCLALLGVANSLAVAA